MRRSRPGTTPILPRRSISADVNASKIVELALLSHDLANRAALHAGEMVRGVANTGLKASAELGFQPPLVPRPREREPKRALNLRSRREPHFVRDSAISGTTGTLVFLAIRCERSRLQHRDAAVLHSRGSKPDRAGSA